MYIYIYILPLFVTLKKVYDRNVVNKYLLLGVIIYYLIDYIYIYTYPFRHHPDNYISQAIIDKACAKLNNIALHKACAKRKRLSALLESSSLCINELIHEQSHKTETFEFLNELLHTKTLKLLCYKNKKLQQLILNSPLHSSLQDQEIIPDFVTNNQPSIHFRKQTKISTPFNLSNINLSATQSSLLERGISFCPSHKLDLVELCHDINEYISLLRKNTRCPCSRPEHLNHQTA